MTAVTIGGRTLGAGRPPLIVAEISGNHNGSLERALRLLDAAAAAGADAVKLQTYTADTITIDHDGPGFRIETGLWAGRTLHDLYAEASTPYAWHEPLFRHAKELGLLIFSSPFDESAVALLEGLDAPAFKIASFEAVDLPLIRRAGASGRPLVISTGMTSAREIAEALEAARSGGAGGVVLLHCVSAYPAPAGDANLRALPRLAAEFGCPVGLSDHSLGTAVAVAAVALGAVLIEKHFILDRAEGGPDSGFSLEPGEFKALVRDCRDAFDAQGEASLARSSTEAVNRQFRRSLYVVEDVAPGEILTARNVRSIRPGFGLAPKHLPDVLGRPAARALVRGEPLAFDMVAEALSA